MRLKPLAESNWCRTTIRADELEAKLAILNKQFHTAVQSENHSDKAQHLLAAAVGAKHRLADPADFNLTADAANAHHLLAAALTVPEDLCLMLKQGNTYQLTAGCVCAPSYWFLPAKTGQSLAEIHEPVPGLNDALGARMNKFFDRLPEDRVFTRRNWLIHASAERFQPGGEQRERLHALAQAEALIVRSETQTLRRLSRTVIVFTIGVECYPLSQIYGHKPAAEALRLALLSRSADEKNAAGQSNYEYAVLKLLAAAAAGT